MQHFEYYDFVGFHAAAATPDDIATLTLDGSTTAVLIDFDGTFADIAETPDRVQVPQRDIAMLARLSRRFDGAVAIVSGRTVASLLPHLEGFSGMISGGHGCELLEGGKLTRLIACDAERLEHIKNAAFEFGIVDPRIIVEEKIFGVALHFRQNPEMEGKARSFLTCLIGDDPDFEVLQAKMALEVKPRAASKALAIEQIMAHARFAGRSMVYAGDDETDETAFAYVNDHDGITIKVGDGPTVARYRAESPRFFRNWLSRQLGQ